jgi:hypothetical protein
VIRCESKSLGPGHPDTATAAHNLGIVLDCLGKSRRALELVESAIQVGVSNPASSDSATQ